jgi:hypothetical protein
MRLLLEHPTVDPAALMAIRNTDGASALVVAAASACRPDDNKPSCEPLLFLLRRVCVAVDPQPSDAQQAHMTKVMEALCQDIHVDDEEHEEHFRSLFDDDQPAWCGSRSRLQPGHEAHHQSVLCAGARAAAHQRGRVAWRSRGRGRGTTRREPSCLATMRCESACLSACCACITSEGWHTTCSQKS